MRSAAQRLTTISLAVCTVGALWPVGTAQAQLAFSVYGGEAITADSDVKLSLPGAPAATYHAVSWRSESFISPFYYGLRLTYWLGRESSFGIAADFTHAKMFSNDDTVVVTREGDPNPQREPLRNTFNELSFSHGHNLVTLNLMGRLFPAGERSRSLLGRLQPYAGLGLGIAIPHVEVALADGSVTNEYQLSWARLSGDLTGGGTLEVKPWTHQLIFGASFSIASTLP